MTAFHVSTVDEPPIYFLGIPTIVRATGQTTNGAFGLVDHLAVPPGFVSPYHTHRLEDEAFYVVEGEVAFVCDGTWTLGGPGTYVFGPRNVAHGFAVVGAAPARLLLLNAPAGFEQFIVELSGTSPAPPDMARLTHRAAAYRIDIHGPLPRMPGEFSRSSHPASDLERLNRRWIQAFNERDWEVERTLLAPDFRAYLSGAPGPLDLAAWSGFMAAFTQAFPDSHIAIDTCLAKGDTVATRWRLTGTHQGDFHGIAPTGRTVAFSGLEFNRVVEGRIVEHWSMFDNLALLREIGAVPA